MALNYGGSPYFNTQSAPMFPQPNGNVYLIQNSLEVANIPTSGGLAALEQQLNAIRQGGGKANVQQSSASNAAVPAESKWDV